MSEQNLNTDIDSLLDGTLDDIADLPEFKPFPAGAHRAQISFEQTEINKSPAISVKFKALETMELANPEDTPCSAGDETNVLYMMDNEFGQGKFKELMKPIAAHFQAGNVRKNMEAAEGAEVLIVTKIRQNKDKTQSYTDLVKLEVL